VNEEIGDEEVQKFDLEEYSVPGIIRKILKTTKLREVVEVRTTRKDKLLTHFDDTPCFKKEWFENLQNECVITFALVGFEQKDFIFKLLVTEKIARFKHLRAVATRFYKAGNLTKAEKIYTKIN
jgi:hypothetical protein